MLIILKTDFSFAPLMFFQVVFLRYTQQWKKKVVFVLNKSDLYQNSFEVYLYFLFVLIVDIS